MFYIRFVIENHTKGYCSFTKKAEFSVLKKDKLEKEKNIFTWVPIHIAHTLNKHKPISCMDWTPIKFCNVLLFHCIYLSLPACTDVADFNLNKTWILHLKDRSHFHCRKQLRLMANMGIVFKIVYYNEVKCTILHQNHKKYHLMGNNTSGAKRVILHFARLYWWSPIWGFNFIYTPRQLSAHMCVWAIAILLSVKWDPKTIQKWITTVHRKMSKQINRHVMYVDRFYYLSLDEKKFCWYF